MTLHRVTVTAFTALLLISGIGTLMARHGPPSPVPPVELSEVAAETPPPVGGEVEEVAARDLTDARATAPPAEPEVLVTTETVVEEALPADGMSDVAAPEGDDDDASDDDGEGDSDDD